MQYTQVSDSTKNLFEERFIQTSLDQVISFTVLHTPKLKLNPTGLCAKVVKTADIFKAAVELEFSGTPDFVIILNEDIFLLLDDLSQIILVDKILAQLGFDFEKDKTLLLTPDVQEFSGLLKRYSYESLEALKLSVESLYQKNNEMTDGGDGTPKRRGRPRKS